MHFERNSFHSKKPYYVAPIAVYIIHMQILLFADEAYASSRALVGRESPTMPQAHYVIAQRATCQDEHP